MAPKDEELTTLCTPKGIYCYKVMPFGLKNAGATYQRAMHNIFNDLLHKNVECYVDDLVVKSTEKGDHMKDLRMDVTRNEVNYSPIEKLCLALVFSIQKLKHYFQAHVIRLVSKANPIKFVMSKPVLSDQLARWYLQFQQFKILYIPQKAVKGQALADFLADHSIPDDWELTDELPNEDTMVVEVQPPWKMYFDGDVHRGGTGAGLVVNQLLGSYEVKKAELRPYHDYARKLIGRLGDVTIQHVPRKENKKVDALAALASSLALPDQTQVTICQKWVVPPPNEAEGEENELKHLVAISEVEKEEWRQPIIDYLCYGILLENPRRRTEIRRRAPRFLYYKDTLYRRTTHRTPTQATPYSLVYGVEAVLPLERQIPLLRLAIQEGITNEENARLRLEALDEKRLEAQQSLEWKFTLKWDGPYVVQEAYSSGAYKLVDADGMRIGPINGKFLKKYYP
ncbi:uncharacterized protein [Nicotiana sylvestris]|uniref:uncharacterized protein n=1 Tax=Nicotiana sylvestris TaxID=4096 RepID=UPI00388C82BA